VTTVINRSPSESVDVGPASIELRSGESRPVPSRPAARMGRKATSNAKGSSASTLRTVAARAFFTAFLVVAALLFFFLAIGPRVLNYQTSTMLTGSMSPGINSGDVVVSVKTPVAELKVGDVITYSIPIDDHHIETHRVMSIERDDAGTTSVTTKGDANPGLDPWSAVLTQDYIYTQAGVVPHLGDVIRALRQPFVQPVILYGGSVLLVVVLLTSIWRKPADDGSAEAKDVAGAS
jgi:signal peptidase I